MRHIINQSFPVAARAMFTQEGGGKRSLRLLSLWSVGLMMLFAAAGPLAMANEPPVALEPATRYSFREDHDPNGTGKFYMGREIALVMSFHGAPWLERPEREEEERLSKLVQLLDLKPGQVAADIGAGSGVITMMMADQVGPKGKVLAVDIQQEMLDLLADKLNRRNLLNVDLVLGTEKSPKIAPGTLDLALMVDVYHELEFPYEMMKEMAASLKPGGRLVFVEYRREDPEVPIKLIHKMSEAQVRKEAEQPEFGLKWKATHKDLPRQHVIVFEKSAQK
ncbi:Ubiquinone/menaquinone biosynthesis C-methyltransferase UbiE [Planctopirus ephydatiae]|uniref:Ubiquinone/menaquinone biosynthesis C-methyltransferase UbiE n=1 Tax=Planctopirus ephydatiae TaxID=2528019 RepID=A0A518GJW0_9PLAN|nr:Ubiquinone/menaquinone biosynthesis C-methyltransferase UbiE [Planctopirus ephydatiae]